MIRGPSVTWGDLGILVGIALLVAMAVAMGASGTTAAPAIPTPQERVVVVVVTATALVQDAYEPEPEPELTNLSIEMEPTSRGIDRPRMDFDYISPAVCWDHPDRDGCFTDADVRQALVGANLTTRRIFRCEAGRTPTIAHPDGEYQPYAIGGQKERGSGQLLPGPGNGLSIFKRWGYTDEGNPFQVRDWADRVQREPGMLVSQYRSTMNGCAQSE